MPIVPVHCPVSHADVVRLTDLEGGTVRIVCPEYDPPSSACRIKQQANTGGPLARLIERTSEGTLAEHGVRCELA
jgi:hypothetical protein